MNLPISKEVKCGQQFKIVWIFVGFLPKTILRRLRFVIVMLNLVSTCGSLFWFCEIIDNHFCEFLKFFIEFCILVWYSRSHAKLS